MKKRLVALTLVAAMALGMTAVEARARAKYLLTTHLLTALLILLYQQA